MTLKFHRKRIVSEIIPTPIATVEKEVNKPSSNHQRGIPYIFKRPMLLGENGMSYSPNRYTVVGESIVENVTMSPVAVYKGMDTES